MQDIFISYAEADEGVARTIASYLEKGRYKTWYYHRDYKGGTYHPKTTEREISESGIFLVLISHNAFLSDFVFPELLHARACEKPVIPVLLGVTHRDIQSQRPNWADAISRCTAVTWTDDNDCLMRIYSSAESIIPPPPLPPPLLQLLYPACVA